MKKLNPPFCDSGRDFTAGKKTVSDGVEKEGGRVVVKATVKGVEIRRDETEVEDEVEVEERDVVSCSGCCCSCCCCSCCC